MKPLDLNSQKYGRLQVLGREGSLLGASTWKCRCDCGQEIVVPGRKLVTGGTKSCGCLAREYQEGSKGWLTHGQGSKNSPNARLYQMWGRIISKCENPNNAEFAQYGGQGIKMSPKWRNDFAAFSRDVGPQPAKAILVRYPNVNGNFEPGNCRWMTVKERNLLTPIKRTPSHLPRANLVGRRFGRLLVKAYVGLNKHSQSQWLCECDCGSQKVVSVAGLKDDPNRGTKSCGCLRHQPGARVRVGPGVFRCVRCKKHKPISERDQTCQSYYRCTSCPRQASRYHPALALWRRAKARAEKAGVPFTIQVSDVIVPTHCPVLGFELRVCHRSEDSLHASYSLDRIEPTKGYIPGNVAVISLRANTLKRDGSLEEFEKLTEWLRKVRT